jgi:hypothetical protein
MRSSTASRLGLIGALTTAMLLSACSSTPKIIANQDPGADFSQYRTYGFDPDFGTDKDQYSSLMSQYFQASISREMSALGYTKSDTPDLLINVYVHTKEKIKSTQTPTTSGYYGYRGARYGGWGGYETTVTQHTEGTINIDIADSLRKQLVWEAEVSGRVTNKVRENPQSTIDQAVTEIFTKYPYTAGSSTSRTLQ